MGLNIYVRWGVQFDEDGGCLDFPKDIHKLQMGISVAEAGNIDHNWPSVSFCRKTATALEAPDPIIGLYPDWNGHNGEELRITNRELDRLLEWQKEARLWLHKQRNVPDNMTEEGFKWFCHKVNQSATLIDFLRQHTDKPGLRIEFN